MIEGPYLAPSSPPETPEPTKKIGPFLTVFNSLQRRSVSLYSLLPPSIIISPGSRNSTLINLEFLY